MICSPSGPTGDPGIDGADGATGPTGDTGPQGPPGDDANVDLLCENDPSLCAETKTVFVTSTPYDGDLGGLSGADDKCQAHADEASLTGRYKAWLSDASSSPSTRFIRAYNYTLVDGSKIARDWTDLTDGNIGHAINVTENGDTITGSDATEAWTNGTVEGTIPNKSPLHHCSDWSAVVGQTGSIKGGTGKSQLRSSGWTFGPLGEPVML